MKTLPGFEAVAPVPQEVFDDYQGRLPDTILELWESEGFGTAARGFIKVIDPSGYSAQLEGCFPRENMIPVFASGLGDLIVWWETSFFNLFFRRGTVRALDAGLRFFAEDLADEEYLRDELDWLPYPEAVERQGPLEFDECFGYVPLLALGGPERVENLQKVRIFEHIQIITQFAGLIQ